MTRNEFNELCDMLWSQKLHGDIMSAALTDSGFRELQDDVLLTGDMRDAEFTGVTPPAVAGLKLSHVMNPVTRTPVAVSDGNDSTVVTVSYGRVFER